MSGEREDDQGNCKVLDGEWATVGLLDVDKDVELERILE
jgi:muconolactone delta-isomerase